MTAPAINPAMNVLPGLAGGGNAQAASGPLAGFEALLAALFGETDIAGVVTGEAAASPTEGKAAETATAETVDAAEGATGAETLLNSLLMAQAAPALSTAAEPTTATPAEPPVAVAESGPPAWGRDKAQGAPAAPALAHADPHARLAEKAAAEPEAAPAEPTTPQPTTLAQRPAPAPQGTEATRAPEARRTAPPPQQPMAPQLTAQPVPAAPTDAAVAASAKASEPEAQTLAPPPVEALARPGAREEIAKAADAPPPPPAAREDKKGPTAARGKDGEDAKVEGVSARSAAAPAAPAAAAAAGPKTPTEAKAPEVEAAQAEARRMDAPDGLEPAHAPEAKSAGHSAPAAGPAAHAVRGSPETVANLAAQIVKKLDGRSTRFDVELDPIGLGKVDVRVEIGAHGRMTASMSFENPQAAAELKSRSADLHRALEQAGFDLSGGLSFDVAGDRGQARQEWSEGQGGGFRGRAFQQALETAGEADMAAASGELRLRRGVTGGVDVRI